MTQRVSLLMPVWNPRRDWLLQAVRSALDDSATLELVVVDDGCPEPVEPLLAEVEDPRLRVVRIPHGGVAAARNMGVEVAQGAWLRFVDADDAVEPGSTAKLLRAVGDDPAVVPYGWTLCCDDSLRPEWVMKSRLEGWIAEECLLGRFTVRHSSLLFPRSVVEAVNGWATGFAVSGDWDFVLRVLERAPVRCEPSVVTRYRKHGAATTANVAGGVRGGHRVLEEYFGRHPELRGTRLERRARARLDAMLARAQLMHGAPVAAVGSAARSLRRHPPALVEEVRQSLPALRSRMLRGRSAVG